MRRELITGTPAQLAALEHLGIGKVPRPDPSDDTVALVAKGYSPEMAARIAGGTLLSRDRSGNIVGPYADGRYA